MFNLEQAIAEWRRQMRAAGIGSPARLDELESHLREDIRVGKSAGTTEAAAFQRAVLRLGTPAAVKSEFNKIERGQIRTVKIGAALWIGGVMITAAVFCRGLLAGKINFLLYAHILMVTAGYGAVFLTGGFGICYVYWRRSHELSPVRQRSLGRAVCLLSPLALGLVIVGIILGMPVSRQLFGAYWRWDPKEIGGVSVALWLIDLVVMQRFMHLSDRASMRMCLGANLVVSLAWFGAGIMDHNRKTHGGAMTPYWPLALFLGIQLCILMLDLARPHEEAQS
jgi:ABC-type transport system involved in cytochrome c biogenesis permease subunit